MEIKDLGQLGKDSSEMKMLRFFTERMMNLTQQIRAVAMASGVTAEQFQKFFADDQAQEKFFAELLAIENPELKAKVDALAPVSDDTKQAIQSLAEGVK